MPAKPTSIEGVDVGINMDFEMREQRDTQYKYIG